MYDVNPLDIHIIKFIQQKPFCIHTCSSVVPEQGTLFSARSQLEHIVPV